MGNITLKRTLATMPDIKTFVFLDTETTGLPFLEGNRTRVTELCLVAVQANHLRLGVFPRIQNKLSFCFNPWKLISHEAEKLTGLSNVLLEQQSGFSAKTVESINAFLAHNPQPTCFVAHNGNRFDYPILKNEIETTGKRLLDNVYYIDSLQAFRNIESTVDEPGSSQEENQQEIPVELSDGYDKLLCDALEDALVGNIEEAKEETKTVFEYRHTENSLAKVTLIQKLNETTPTKRSCSVFTIGEPAKKQKVTSTKKRLNYNLSYKLVDVYQRLTSKTPKDSHRAESDVIMMLTCAATFGDKFVDWAIENSRNFCDIRPMKPGKKFGM